MTVWLLDRLGPLNDVYIAYSLCVFSVSSSNDNDDPALLSSLLKSSIRSLGIATSGPKTFAIAGREVLEEISRVYFFHLGACNDNQPTGATFLLHFGFR